MGQDIKKMLEGESELRRTSCLMDIKVGLKID